MRLDGQTVLYLSHWPDEPAEPQRVPTSGFAALSEPVKRSRDAQRMVVMTQICTMKCPHCGGSATKTKPEERFKCEGCGWKLS